MEGMPLQGYDYHGQLVQYPDFPPLRLNRINNKRYLVYTYVDRKSLLGGINLHKSLQQFGIPELLFLCMDSFSCNRLNRSNSYHYAPRSLIESTARYPQEHHMHRSYQGHAMWIRAIFNHHLVLAGVHVACIDADVVFVRDPRPILFSPLADISISLEWHPRWFQWTWNYPSVDLPDGWDPADEATQDQARLEARNFLGMNNGIIRCDSNPRTHRYMEVLRARSLVEIADWETYRGWDQSAIGRVFYEAKVQFETKPALQVNGEPVLVSVDNLLDLRVLTFQPRAPLKHKQFWLTERPEDLFSCHAFGMLQKGPDKNGWGNKVAWLKEHCAWHLEDREMRRGSRALRTNGEGVWSP